MFSLYCHNNHRQDLSVICLTGHAAHRADGETQHCGGAVTTLTEMRRKTGQSLGRGLSDSRLQLFPVASDFFLSVLEMPHHCLQGCCCRQANAALVPVTGISP